MSNCKTQLKTRQLFPKGPKPRLTEISQWAQFLISQWITNVVQDGIEIECQFHLSKFLEYTDFKN